MARIQIHTDLYKKDLHDPDSHGEITGLEPDLLECEVKWAFTAVQFNSVTQSCLTLGDPRDYSTPDALFIINSQSLLKPMPIESVMPSNHLIPCHPLLLPPLIFPSIRVFSNESALHIRWPKYWSFSFSISPSNEYSRLISFRID